MRWPSKVRQLARPCAAIGYALTLMFFSALPQFALAHKPSDAFLVFSQSDSDPLSIEFSVAIKDLDAALEDIDADDDRKITWGEVNASLPKISRLLTKEVVFSCDKVMRESKWVFAAIEKRNDGSYIRFSAQPSTPGCQPGQSVELLYSLFSSIDATHRLMLIRKDLSLGSEFVSPHIPSSKPIALERFNSHSSAGSSAIAGVTPLAQPAWWLNFFKFIPEGFVHLVTGWDHVAFVLTLVLGVRVWGKVSRRLNKAALKRLCVVITAFTVGHSITLVLAATGKVTFNAVWIEALIALSIALSAALNLVKLRGVLPAFLPFAFGLIHGFGFSSVLSDMGLGQVAQVWSLAGFNIGIEIGQLFFVGLWVTVQYWLLRWQGYQKWVVQGGSWLLLLAATLLTISRATA
jgi:HupE / UreJ protein